MPAVKARPAPVTTAARTRSPRATLTKAVRSSAMSSGTMRFSGGRSSVTQAQPCRSSPQTSADTGLVPAHGRIDGTGPRVETPRQVPDIAEAEASQILGDGGAPDALVAIDYRLGGRVELARPNLHLLDGNVQRVLEPAEPRLPILTDVEQHRGRRLAQARLQFSRRKLRAHARGSSAQQDIMPRRGPRGGGSGSRERSRLSRDRRD